MVVFLCRQKALNVTGDKGVEPAMEWLLAHSDDLTPECVADSTNSTDSNVAAEASASTSTGTIETTAEVKSFKCEDW